MMTLCTVGKSDGVYSLKVLFALRRLGTILNRIVLLDHKRPLSRHELLFIIIPLRNSLLPECVVVRQSRVGLVARNKVIFCKWHTAVFRDCTCDENNIKGY